MRILKVISVILIVSVLTLFSSTILLAQVQTPDTLRIFQVEAYRNCVELNDQLYLVTFDCSYTGAAPAEGINDTMLVRLMNGATELSSTSPYNYYNNGYEYGLASIYFSAADAPAWAGGYSVYMSGNPTLSWTSATAATAMTGAIADDGGVLTNETAAANSAAANDMTLLPVGPAVDDAYYFAADDRFDLLTVNVGTNGNGVWTLTWEYYDATTWSELPNVNDGSTGFTAGTGYNDISWDMPGDWAKTTISAIEAYWVRARVSAFTNCVQNPLGTQSWTNSVDPPSVNTSTFSKWYDDGTLNGTSQELTQRLRFLAAQYESQWTGMGTIELIYASATGNVLTAAGEDYFSNSIENLRVICPDLFPAATVTPDWEERTYTQAYANTLEARWLGTWLDTTNLATNLGASHMWVISVLYLAFAFGVAILVVRYLESYKVAAFIFAMMIPFGWFAGLLTTAALAIASLLAIGGLVYVFAYRTSV